MASFNTYMKQTQRFLREAKQNFIDVDDLTEYINRARRETAERAMCVRRLTPISGAVMTATVVAGGANYSSATTVSITPPDFPSGAGNYPGGNQATALPIIQGGILTAVDMSYGGSGYFQPQATVTDPNNLGSGASVTLAISPINILKPNQEQYPFSDINVSMFPGIASVYSIKSVAVIYANYRYVLPMYSFSTYQAFIRQYPFQYTYVPTFCSQYGRGTDGMFFAYPWPSQEYQWEFDCFCVPMDLTAEQEYDAIPQPWSDAVPYFAAHLGYLGLQNFNAAAFYLKLYDQMVQRKSDYAMPGRAVNPYGRW